MTLLFYTNPKSRGQIARWALHEVGADYEQRIVAYGEEMKGAYQRTVNPMGKVPAIDHDGQVVTECAAICHYLAETHPQAGLLPTAQERAAYFRWLFFAAGPLEQAVTNRSMGYAPPEDPSKQGMLGYGDFELTMDVLEGWLAAHDHVCGERFTMADVYLGSHVAWGLQFGTMPEREAFRDYADRLTARAAWKEAKAIDLELIEQSPTPG
ncbi:glutathione S-transferase family protein [Sphingomicrobium astaxanthinifaciens]|uniref:glutathione S-transferase family protein n=1 Tax=Sphingomicrobium astaxanthinifaciens TaxID=1227949 RepID=UPI001FCBF7FA|nr:glutathione S-transferase family protein [Sphingomicrobium astaxanthinifaciens]MCJ7420611.1 glutathione S-transferase family protein [Sphingomicrobium astaxanthinifaciens]